MTKTRQLLLGCAVLLSTRLASADMGDWQDKWESNYDPGRATRRSGFAAGLWLGAAVAGISGYPNDVEKINDPTYAVNMGTTTGAGVGLWIGGALRDWIVVGIGLAGVNASGRGYESSGGAFVFHLEGFPLFYEGPIFRNLAVIGDFGAGKRTITTNSNTVTVADGGSMSFVALGLLYEPWRLGSHVTAGPILEVAEQFSQSMTATTATAGFQIGFYGGPD